MLILANWQKYTNYKTTSLRTGRGTCLPLGVAEFVFIVDGGELLEGDDVGMLGCLVTTPSVVRGEEKRSGVGW